ncbi:hypothetical protein BC938DRAFT_474008 [Jimgerdemannia flammicorona]|uniref:Uncharacterized protein n=1 Tax=Jimgerdemannia flammicorona TaxID=994334 RepID=A0A433Q2Y3_9FUNG|nr:hypothetical protein BC938DRAFT_474008 [Jimgerdemannia flammicorona]
MLGRINPIPTSLHTHDANGLVLDERVEHADRVTTTADASHNHVRQLARLLQQLLLALFANHALEIAHNKRERVRSDRGADEVVCGRDVRDPVTHGLIDCILKGAGAGLNRDDRGAKHAHAEDVKGLATTILGTHVDDAFKAKFGADSGSCDAMLTGARFGNNTAFA